MALLFEMLTGQRAFRGDTPADAIAAVLNEEPDRSLLPPATPAGVRRLLHRCLEKNPKRRLCDMGDARLELEDDAALPSPVQGKGPGAIAWAVALGAAGVTAAALPTTARGTGRDLDPVQFTLDAPPGHVVVGVPVPSPDGRRLVFTAFIFTARSDLPQNSAIYIASLDGGTQPRWRRRA